MSYGRRDLKFAVLEAFKASYPPLVQIFKKHDLNVNHLFILWYIRCFSMEPDTVARRIIRSEVDDAVRDIFGLKDSTISGLFNELLNQGLLEKGSFSVEEKKRLYGDGSGRKDLLAITPAGIRVLESFKTDTLAMFARVTEPQPNKLVRRFVTTAIQIALKLQQVKSTAV